MQGEIALHSSLSAPNQNKKWPLLTRIFIRTRVLGWQIKRFASLRQSVGYKSQRTLCSPDLAYKPFRRLIMTAQEISLRHRPATGERAQLNSDYRSPCTPAACVFNCRMIINWRWKCRESIPESYCGTFQWFCVCVCVCVIARERLNPNANNVSTEDLILYRKQAKHRHELNGTITRERDTSGHNEGAASNHTGGNNQDQGRWAQGQEMQRNRRHERQQTSK